MKDTKCSYWNVETGYHCNRVWRTDARAYISFNKSKHTGTTIVYKKTVPISTVLGLTKLYKGFKDVPSHFIGLSMAYQFDGEELHSCNEGTDAIFTDEDVRYESN